MTSALLAFPCSVEDLSSVTAPITSSIAEFKSCRKAQRRIARRQQGEGGSSGEATATSMAAGSRTHLGRAAKQAVPTPDPLDMFSDLSSDSGSEEDEDD